MTDQKTHSAITSAFLAVGLLAAIVSVLVVLFFVWPAQ
jgi:hypothetical protein